MNRNIKDNTAQPFRDVPELRWVDRISSLMDSKFTIPGTSIRFGLDPILSLFPLLGSFSTWIISTVLIAIMFRNGASGKLVIRMMINASLDAIISSIPLIGSVFDIFYKANDRNVKLLKQYYQEGKHRGKGIGLLLITLLVILLILGLIIYLIFIVSREIFEWLEGIF